MNMVVMFDEGVCSDLFIICDLLNEIMFESVLYYIFGKVNLIYDVKNEVI